jgi:hypothetical protein
MTSRSFVTGVAGGHPAQKVSRRGRITGGDGIERVRAVVTNLTGNAACKTGLVPSWRGSHRVTFGQRLAPTR